jgi:predicted dinucleotide-binding enzyme
MHLSILGYGHVGGTLARALLAAGHHVTLATNPGRPEGAIAVRDADPRLAAATVAEPHDAVTNADAVLLAVPFLVVEDVLTPLADALDGALLIDATNPVGPGLTHGLGSRHSGAQAVAALAPGASVVKAFSVYGYENLADPPTRPDGIRPAMPYAGDDPTAKATVATLLTSLGWEPIDAGPLAAAVDLEHLTLLWVRMVRAGGLHPRLVWAALRDR